MNKREKEVIQLQLEAEEDILAELEKQYKRALNDINEKIKFLQTDELTQSRIYQIQYQQALKGQVEGIIEKLHSDGYTSIQRFLNDAYTDAFVATAYDLAGQGIPLIMPIDQNAAVKAIINDSKIKEDLYTSLGVDAKALKKSIRQEITRGIASGMNYQDIARNISDAAKAPLSRAKTIAKTESHRIQQASTYDAQKAAKARGADVVKQWDSTLDGKTRSTHRKLDGQIREVEEPFEMDGKEAMFPGEFGDPAEDCNCRCVSLTRARWALDDDELKTLQQRAEYFGLDKTESFEEYKKNYLKTIENPENYSTIKSIRKSVELPETPEVPKISEVPKNLTHISTADNNFVGKEVDVKVLQVIDDAISARKAVKSDFVFNEIKIAKFPKGDKSVFITDFEVLGGKESIRLYLNTEFFTGKTLEELDVMCSGYYASGWWKSKTVSDLVNHEIMHARINHNNSFEKVERLYSELGEDKRTKGFCGLVDNDTTEFLNEMYVAMCNGEKIDPKYVDVFNEYVKEFLGG